MLQNKKGQQLVNIIALMGAILIFVGFAWLIGYNWHEIPTILRLLILIFATVGAYTSGVFVRQTDKEGVGRALICLGALLYILSLFLVSQMYNLGTTTQDYAWLWFLAWTVILATAYFLDSPENLVLGLIVFFPWLIMQYSASIEGILGIRDPVFSFILLFSSTGALLYGISIFHDSINHKFTNLYRFWMVFYFSLIFYTLSFQAILPTLSEFSFQGEAFSIFLIIFIIACFFGFLIGSLSAVNKNPKSINEIMIFVGIIVVLFVLIFLTKTGEGIVGNCYQKGCYAYQTQNACISAPKQLNCAWRTDNLGMRAVPVMARDETQYCKILSCWDLKTESECKSTPYLRCNWRSSPEKVPKIEQPSVTQQPNQIPVPPPPQEPLQQQINYCEEKQRTCYIHEFNEQECKKDHNCIWANDYGRMRCAESDDLYIICNNYVNQKDQCLKQSICDWSPSHGNMRDLPLAFWLLWVLNNMALIGFIILILGYGIYVSSSRIVNLGIMLFILDVISRYIGFWMELEGYFAFSMLAILGGVLLILGALFIPKLREDLIERTNQ